MKKVLVVLAGLALCAAMTACATVTPSSETAATTVPSAVTTTSPFFVNVTTTTKATPADDTAQADTLVGTWTATNNNDGIEQFVFNADGTGSLTMQGMTVEGTYTLTGDGTLSLMYGTTALPATYRFDGDTLLITANDITLSLTRA